MALNQELDGRAEAAPTVQTPVHESNLTGVQTQAVVQHPLENNTPSIVENGPSEDGNHAVSTIKEKLHRALLDLASDEPPPSEDLLPWGDSFAFLRTSPSLINPAITIYGLGVIGLPLSERDALIANLNRPAPDPDTKMCNAVVDLTTTKITELTTGGRTKLYPGL
ncbi:hypothetical protein VE02_04454 [Pseudogymnoascus sp. 03VT05]|nr:hypothetical protein VE02_04454 [Pseudogymnoascus sp. 03VT05]